MKANDFKKIIKQAVKEAIQEELKDILLEAVKAPKMQPASTGNYGAVTENLSNVVPTADKRQKYMEILNETANPGQDTLSFNTNSFVPRPMNTAAEGSSLPPGELNMSQIMGLLNNK
jgi:hypothetical protein